jgi:hypothetical protein
VSKVALITGTSSALRERLLAGLLSIFGGELEDCEFWIALLKEAPELSSLFVSTVVVIIGIASALREPPFTVFISPFGIEREDPPVVAAKLVFLMVLLEAPEKSSWLFVSMVVLTTGIESARREPPFTVVQFGAECVDVSVAATELMLLMALLEETLKEFSLPLVSIIVLIVDAAVSFTVFPSLFDAELKDPLNFTAEPVSAVIVHASLKSPLKLLGTLSVGAAVSSTVFLSLFGM